MRKPDLAGPGFQVQHVSMNTLSRISSTVKGANQKKLVQREILSACPSPSGRGELLSRLSSCGNFQVWRHFEDGGRSLRLGSFCNIPRLCPLCARIHSVRRFFAVKDWLDIKCPGGDLILVTVTLRNGDNLSLQRHYLSEFRRKLVDVRKNHYRGRYKEYTEIPKFEGFFLKEEIKRGKNSGLWHPHFHGLWWSPVRVEWGKFRSEINSLMTDGIYEHSIDFAVVERSGSNYVRGILESVKYLHKFDASPEFVKDIWTVYKETYGKRMFFRYGSFVGLEVDREMEINSERKIEFYQLLKLLDSGEFSSEILTGYDYFRRFPFAETYFEGLKTQMMAG